MIRATIFCPKLAQYPAKGISPDEVKIMYADMDLDGNYNGYTRTQKENEIMNKIKAQTKINNSFNARAVVLGDILESKLKDIDMTWCKDGCIVISFDNTIEEIEQLIEDEGLEIRADRPEIKHKVRPLDPNDNSKGSEEDIDEIFEPLTADDKKKLKSRLVINQFKLKNN